MNKTYVYSVKIDKETNRIYLDPEKEVEYGEPITTPQAARDLLCKVFDADKLAEEHAYLISLDYYGEIKGLFEISHGTTWTTYFGPREIIQRVLLSGGVQMITAHNHPDENPKPSDIDNDTHKNMVKACEIMTIGYLDDLIISRDSFYSAKEYDVSLYETQCS